MNQVLDQELRHARAASRVGSETQADADVVGGANPANEKHEPDEVALEVGGLGILAIGQREAGAHWLLPNAEQLVPLQLIVVPLSPGQDARKVWDELRGRRRAWREARQI